MGFEDRSDVVNEVYVRWCSAARQGDGDCEQARCSSAGDAGKLASFHVTPSSQRARSILCASTRTPNPKNRRALLRALSLGELCAKTHSRKHYPCALKERV